MGTAREQGALWGAKPGDWAEVQEGTAAKLYEAVLESACVGTGTSLLDIGCGSGMFCRMAAALGARVSGMDASEPLLAIARERTPAGDFMAGEMEELEHADRLFDVVTGFNSFQYAASPVAALREARRVARKGGSVVIATWGKREETEAASCLAALGRLLPPAPPGAPGPFALSEDGALEGLVKKAGLLPVSLEKVDCIWRYPDEKTALRGLLSIGPAVRAVQYAGLSAVAEALTAAIKPFETSFGSYRLKNRFHYLVCVA